MNPKVPKRPGAQCVSQATRAKRRKAEEFGPQAALCRLRPCAVAVHEVMHGKTPTCFGKLEVHHEPPRGRDGRGKDRDTITLCAGHHTERHSMPLKDFERKYGVDLLDLVGAMRQGVGRG